MKLKLAAALIAALPAAALAAHHEKGEHHMGAASPDALADAFCANVESEDAAKLASLYTDDADSYDPGGTIAKGRAEIAASWQGFFDAFDDITCALDKAGLIENDDNAAAWGLWTMTATPAGGGDMTTMKGRYMDVSVKTDHGWLYRADHASMMAAPSEE